jgi:hypothetical protein
MMEHGKLTIRDVARKAGVWWASDVNLIDFDRLRLHQPFRTRPNGWPAVHGKSPRRRRKFQQPALGRNLAHSPVSKQRQGFEEVKAGKLHCELASKPIRAFHDDGSDAIAGNAVEQGNEARARGHRVSTFDGRVVEPIDDDEPGLLGVALNRRSLPCLAVLIAGHVRRRRRRAHVPYGFHPFPLAHYNLTPNLCKRCRSQLLSHPTRPRRRERRPSMTQRFENNPCNVKSVTSFIADVFYVPALAHREEMITMKTTLAILAFGSLALMTSDANAHRSS